MAYQLTPESIDRARFLKSLGLSAAALSALYFSACSKATDVAPTPALADGVDSQLVAVGNSDPYSNKVNFTLDLTLPENIKLKTPGQFASAGLVVVANTRDGNFVALRSICTHASGSLWYRASQNDFRCQDHGGLFNTDGRVKMNPPTKPVQTYKVTLSTDKNTLQIAE